jgi:hypothetical protein
MCRSSPEKTMHNDRAVPEQKVGAARHSAYGVDAEDNKNWT